MTARRSEVGKVAPFERRGCGVRAPGDTPLAYDLVVIGADVAGVVGAAGGWLCDRVRAGWQVTVSVPAAADMRALTILGVHAEVGDSAVDVLRRQRPAAVAVDAALLRHDSRLRHEVLCAVDDTRTEVTVWGESSLFTSDRRFSQVRHRLTAASRAFKERALLATARPATEPGREDFVSASLWYPLDGPDLEPIGADRL